MYSFRSQVYLNVEGLLFLSVGLCMMGEASVQLSTMPNDYETYN